MTRKKEIKKIESRDILEYSSNVVIKYIFFAKFNRNYQIYCKDLKLNFDKKIIN